MDVEEDPILGRWGGLGYGGRHGGWGLGRGLRRVWCDEEVEEDSVLGLGRLGLGYGRLGHLGRVGGWGLGRGLKRVWDDDIENDEDAVVGLLEWAGWVILEWATVSALVFTVFALTEWVCTDWACWDVVMEWAADC